jgi:HAD superfamily hydrolase (TIGR01662 family)
MKAVFIDKDGTLIIDVPNNVDPDRIQLYPDAGLALRQLQQAGYRLFIISNQAGVAHGYFQENALVAVTSRSTGFIIVRITRMERFGLMPFIVPAGNLNLVYSCGRLRNTGST